MALVIQYLHLQDKNWVVSKTLRVITFFSQNPKMWLFTFLCFVAYVFSNNVPCPFVWAQVRNEQRLLLWRHSLPIQDIVL